jgi:hypothetical protein
MNGIAPRLPELLVRMLAAALLVLAMGMHFERAIVRSLLPALHSAVAWLGDDYAILDMAIARDGANDTLQTRADFSHSFLINGHVVEPLNGRGWLQVNHTLGGILAYSELLLILLLAWPAAGFAEYAWRALLGVPLAGALVVLNVTSTTLAELWAALQQELAPASYSPLLAWSRFLMGGGGWVLALTLAALAIVGGRPRRRNVISPSFSSHLASATSGS